MLSRGKCTMNDIREMYLDARLNPFWDEIISIRKEIARGNQPSISDLAKRMRGAIIGLTLANAVKIIKDDTEFPDPRSTQKDNKDALTVLQRNLLEQAQLIDNLKMQLAIANAV